MKRRAVFLRKIGEKEYRKIGEKKLKDTQETIRFKDHTFVVPKEADAYHDKRKTYLFFDWDTSTIINFTKHEIGINPEFLDKLIARNIVGQLVAQLRASLQPPDKWKLMPYIIAFIFGAVVGYMFGTNPALLGM